MAKWKSTVRLYEVNPMEVALRAGVSGIHGGRMELTQGADEAIIAGGAEQEDSPPISLEEA